MLSLLALPNAYTLGGVRARSPARMGASPVMGWDMKTITPDGTLEQRVEGKTRKTWTFNDLSKDRVQVAVKSEGRPVKADIQLWIGPDWTPFTLKAYSEDGKERPIQALIGTRNKAAMIEVLNAPNNPKQTFEVFTNNGELNSLSVCFDTPDPGNTVRIVNLAPVEFPCYIHLNEM